MIRLSKLFEDAGMRNLIKEYGVTSTRTSHYTKDEKFADYAFITQGIKVKDFKVLPDEFSDHTPLSFVSGDIIIKTFHLLPTLFSVG